MDITGKLAQANGRLKAAKIGLKIEQQADRLYLRGTLPAKPGSKHTHPHQQRLSLRLPANPDGLKQAERLARKIGGEVALGEFKWQNYQRQRADRLIPTNADELIAQAQAQYLAKGGRIESWKGDYTKGLSRLNREKPVTLESLTAAVEAWPNDTQGRKRAAYACGYLARIAGIEFDAKALAGSYGPRQVEPRDIPSDQLIRECWDSIVNPDWRWFYGMLATYGLRPHEVFKLNFDQLRTGAICVEVNQDTKTGRRQCWPFYPEWFEEFGLSNVQIPPVNVARGNEAIGRQATHYFWKKLPFNLYSLRHAWAIRTINFGLPIELASQQQGHSVATHSRIYHRWISQDIHQRAFEAILRNPARPTPP